MTCTVVTPGVNCFIVASLVLSQKTTPVTYGVNCLGLFYHILVVLPPRKEDKTGTKILTMDHDLLSDKQIGSETTDDNNKSKLNVEVGISDYHGIHQNTNHIIIVAGITNMLISQKKVGIHYY